jgi:thiamine biosynthesis lipoprotein
MGTVFRLIFYAEDSTMANHAAKVVFARIDTLNAILSDYLPESELNRLCARAGTGEKVRVSPDLWFILKQSARFSKESKGAFDVTIGNLSRLWRRARNLKTLPDSARIATARALTDYRNIRLYRRNHRVELLKKGIQLDFGGIAQGYAADECLRLLRSFGIRQALADAGGDLALGDPPPDAGGWKVEIPTADTVKTLLSLSNCGITTSGAQYRYLEANGRRYSHIIDPRTGWGLTHRILVTVMAPSGIEADAWATALSVSDETAKIEKKGKKWRVWRLQTDL